MQDTIDLLEAIGSDASLRHASAEDLARVLEQADATPFLTEAAATGDRKVLAEEFGDRREPPPTQISQAPAWEEEDEDDEVDEPRHNDDDLPLPL